MDRRHHSAGQGVEATPADYVLEVTCLRETEADVKAMVANVMPAPQFRLRSLRTLPTHAADQVSLQAGYATAARDDQFAEDAVRTLSQQAGVTLARWSIADEQAADWSP
jgi:putative Mg2+ transporter-C (MgtC) family protein